MPPFLKNHNEEKNLSKLETGNAELMGPQTMTTTLRTEGKKKIKYRKYSSNNFEMTSITAEYQKMLTSEDDGEPE